MKVTKEQLSDFVKQLIISQSLDFPSVARSQGLNWFKDLLPLLTTNLDFRASIEEALSDFKYALLNGIFQIAHDGKPRTGRVVEISYVKEIIKYIDSGALFGAVKEEKEPEVDEETIQRHLARLNLKGSNNES